ncbi:NAD(P)/FAD-dependent oxidoreductase [Candidatus Nitrosoglobus terrae]|nr:FAD/NAD(P)-binding oxidoreductase [Candidatus Nitrosoglobus terrae]
MADTKHYQVLIIGGGTAGITVAASLRRNQKGKDLSIAIVEPSEDHYYQPAFTLVGAGAYSLEKTRRSEGSLIPQQVEWIHDTAVNFNPHDNQVTLASGDPVNYDYLVICPGLALDWEKIEGLTDTIGSNGVCSNYSPKYATYTWQCVQGLNKGDKAIFTQPPLPFKCPGAPQKIAYLTADHLRKKGVLSDCDLYFCTQSSVMFGVPLFSRELDKVVARYGIHAKFQHNLIAVDGQAKQATFEIVGGEKPGERVTLDFDMLHVTPPQSPPEVIKSSPLANEAGYIDVHKHSMQHIQFKNVFGLGDACSTPNSKTAAAIRKQAPVVVKNLLHLISGSELEEGYDGYASCPLTTAYGKIIMAEFIYGGKVTPTFPLDPRKERWLNWWIKVTGLPIMYWDYMLKGYEWFFKHNNSYVEPTK